MSESTMRQRFLRGIRPLDGVAIEDRLRPGTPDTFWIGGCGELKWLRAWPTRGGPVLLSHYTKSQRIWLRRRGKRGGVALLILQVKKQWLFFDHEFGTEEVGVSATREELECRAIKHFPNGLQDLTLQNWLRSLAYQKMNFYMSGEGD